MTTCRDVIQRSLRMTKVLASGQELEASEAEDGMIVLQGMYDQWFNLGVFGGLTEVYKTEDYTSVGFERIIGDGCTITLPGVVDNVTPVELTPVTIVESTGAKNYIYSNGGWVLCTGLLLADEAPLAYRDSTGLSALMAIDYVDEFGGELTAAHIRRGHGFRSGLNLGLASTEPEYF